MLPFSTLLRISRPRFWHYVLGPMLIFFASSDFVKEIQGSFARGGTDRMFYGVVVLIILGYFTLPANLWIYGWNDIADGDTDKLNSKKGTYEEKIEDSDILKRKLKRSIWIWNIGYVFGGSILLGAISYLQWNDITLSKGSPGGLISISLWLFGSIIALIPFLITSYLYSCQPLRAKAKPFIDGVMNILYIAVPLLLHYYYLGYGERNGSEEEFYRYQNMLFINYIEVFLASLFRCMAMHCYSAIPDIEPDRQAGLNTTAVYLGKQKSLIYCGVLYTLAAVLSFPVLGWFSIVGGIIYVSVMAISYYKKDIFGLYKLFPYINLVVGFSLFWYIILYL